MYKSLLAIIMVAMAASSVAAQAKTPGTIFNKKQVAAIGSYQQSFKNIKTAADLAKVYRSGYKMSEGLNEKLTNYTEPKIENFVWLEKFTPGFKLEYGGEATVIYLTPDYQAFMHKAKATTGKSDDLFLRLMTDAFGKTGDAYPTWFVMTWDYGGYTMLGKGKHTAMLKKMTETAKSSPEFAIEIKAVRERLFYDIRDSVNFAVPKVAVAVELNKILADKSLSVEEKRMVQTKLKEINGKPPKDIKFQFNCEKAECAYG